MAWLHGSFPMTSMPSFPGPTSFAPLQSQSILYVPSTHWAQCYLNLFPCYSLYQNISWFIFTTHCHKEAFCGHRIQNFSVCYVSQKIPHCILFLISSFHYLICIQLCFHLFALLRFLQENISNESSIFFTILALAPRATLNF